MSEILLYRRPAKPPSILKTTSSLEETLDGDLFFDVLWLILFLLRLLVALLRLRAGEFRLQF